MCGLAAERLYGAQGVLRSCSARHRRSARRAAELQRTARAERKACCGAGSVRDRRIARRAAGLPRGKDAEGERFLSPRNVERARKV